VAAHTRGRCGVLSLRVDALPATEQERESLIKEHAPALVTKAAEAIDRGRYAGAVRTRGGAPAAFTPVRVTRRAY